MNDSSSRQASTTWLTHPHLKFIPCHNSAGSVIRLLLPLHVTGDKSSSCCKTVRNRAENSSYQKHVKHATEENSPCVCFLRGRSIDRRGIALSSNQRGALQKFTNRLPLSPPPKILYCPQTQGDNQLVQVFRSQERI
jgi:hypothetical protein